MPHIHGIIFKKMDHMDTEDLFGDSPPATSTPKGAIRKKLVLISNFNSQGKFKFK